MHRLRLSSEGPEVVSQIPDKFFVPYLNRSPRSALYQKQIDGKSPVPLYPIPSVREGSSGFDEDQQDRGFARGSISLFTTLLIVAAFLLGGGVGGGIGGAFISKDRATIANLTNTLAALPTVTMVASAAPTACYMDQAGCPNINNKTYTSTTPDYSFLQICDREIISPTAESIDLSTKVQTSWNACMDSCAAYNQKAKKRECQGATWQMWSTTNPENNAVCTLKSSAVVTSMPKDGNQLCSGILQS